MTEQELIDLIACAVVALYGSIARTVADNRDTGARGWRFIWLLAANACISGFCALMAIPLAQMLHLDGMYYKIFLAGMAGYMGLGFLAYCEKEMKRRFGFDDTRDSHSQNPGSAADARDPETPAR